MDISQRDARRLFLHQQGLLRGNAFGRGIGAVHRAITRLSYLQIDTISVVARAHEHILASRVANFTPALLHRLYERRHLYEHWGHAAAYLPFEHYRYSIPVMKGYAASRKVNRKLAREILARIRSDGPLQSRDFEDSRNREGGGWWDWKPAKQVLEHLFLSGELMVTRRDGFQKVFDLPERVIPDHVDTAEPTAHECATHLVRSMSHALGIATDADLAYALPTMRRLAKIDLKREMKQAAQELAEEGEFTPVQVEGAQHYARTELLDLLPLRLGKRSVNILSPFDNLVINRRRMARLFKFDYQLECYVPEAKRVYGYFCLPILWGDELIGRLDAKAERKDKYLAVKNLVLEPHTKPSQEVATALASGIAGFASANNCDTARVVKSTPKTLAAGLNARLTKSSH